MSIELQPLALAGVDVLVVDADESAALSTVAALSGCFALPPAVASARSGRAGAEMLRRGTYDLVVADLGALTDLGGDADEAVGRLAKLGGPAITVIISEQTSVSAGLAALRAGAHDYCTKPLVGDWFAERLAALALRHGRSLALRQGANGVTGPANYPPLSLATSRSEEPDQQPHLQSASKHPKVLPMWQQEQLIIERAIASFSGNIALAAAALQLSPSTIYRKRQAWADAAGRNKGAA